MQKEPFFNLVISDQTLISVLPFFFTNKAWLYRKKIFSSQAAIFFNVIHPMYQASLSDKKLVVDILVSAFENYTDDNQINLIVKQDQKRLQRMGVLMEYLFVEAMSFGEVYIADNKKACLLIKYSDREKITWKMIRISAKLAFKCIGISRVPTVLKRQKEAKKHYPKEPHIKPIIFGVKDEVKGKGVGPRMMFEIREHFKDNKLPAIIDTVAESNLKLYQRFGFKIINKVESFDFPIYFLKRDA